MRAPPPSSPRVPQAVPGPKTSTARAARHRRARGSVRAAPGVGEQRLRGGPGRDLRAEVRAGGMRWMAAVQRAVNLMRNWQRCKMAAVQRAVDLMRNWQECKMAAVQRAVDLTRNWQRYDRASQRSAVGGTRCAALAQVRSQASIRAGNRSLRTHCPVVPADALPPPQGLRPQEAHAPGLPARRLVLRR